MQADGTAGDALRPGEAAGEGAAPNAQVPAGQENAQVPAGQETEEMEDPAAEERTAGRELGFPVVGVGASAGGLEAFSELLKHVPPDTGMAFVFVQHLDPTHGSSLPEILPRSTRMPVDEASDGMGLEPGHVYVIPPASDLAVLHGVLHLMSRPQAPARHMPVDYLFRSLAEDQGRKAIGVILSGTGSDGAAGVKAIKTEGGITFAQDEQTARYSGMPHAAAATGQVDLVLPPAQIAEELVRIVHHPQVVPLPRGRRQAPPPDALEAMQKIFILLRRAHGIDFSQYKQSTVERRVARRLILHRLDSLNQYVRHLQQSPGEVRALFEDMLINVTGFFREPETFDVLKEKVFPQICEDKDPETPLRIWVPACSTGEEAYSIAIALLEHLGERSPQVLIQIFATDISDTSIEKARAGRYLENIAGDVSQERLRRFFVKLSDGYQISRNIRDMCVFARQNVSRDPPFSNLDLLSCRNLLIYMGPRLQQRTVPMFHYALKPTGYLLLGRSETVGSFADLFALVDREHKIYVKKAAATRLPPEFRLTELGVEPENAAAPAAAGRAESRDLEKEADHLVIAKYVPPGVIVDADMEILQFRGQTGRFLEPSPGTASLNLLRMIRPGLALDLRATIHEVRKEHRAIRKEGLRVFSNSGRLNLNIEVHPLGPPETSNPHFLVLFEEVRPAAAPPQLPPAEEGPKVEGTAEAETQRLRQELQQTKATLQSIIEEHESTNEELRAANEEIQSANEELQSTNEELETAKEELQSTNEELITLNAELENQNNEANRAIDDYKNLYNSLSIPVILLDNDLRIRSFTPPAERQLNLRSADQGRYIGDLRLGIEIDDLEGKIREVLGTLNALTEEVRGEDGRWYSLRIRPYRTTDDRITGVVVVLVDVTEHRQAQERVRYAQALCEDVLATVHRPLLVLDAERRVMIANRAFYRAFHLVPEEVGCQVIYDVGGGQWDNPDLRRLLDEIVLHDPEVEGYEIVHDFPRVGRRKLRLGARRIEQEGDRTHLVLLSVEEMSDA